MKKFLLSFCLVLLCITFSNAQGSVQCSGLTKKGIQCKNKTLNASGYCYLHEDQNTKSAVKEPNSTKGPAIEKTSSDNSKQTGESFVGPRGGHYHYSKSGKKVYEKH